VTHYDALGVDPSADAATVRRAYLSEARRHHPDAEGGDAERMLAVNDAWAVRGDPARRASDDATLRSAARSIAERLDRGFSPIHADDDDDEALDAWRFGEDEGDPRTAPHRGVVLAPVVLLGVAAVVGTVWLITGHDAVLVATVLVAAASLVGFLAAPLVAMAKASQYERRD